MEHSVPKYNFSWCVYVSDHNHSLSETIKGRRSLEDIKIGEGNEVVGRMLQRWQIYSHMS